MLTILEIRQATTEDELDAVRTLAHTFVGWMKDLYPDAEGPLNEYFASLESELASLPGVYAPPAGRLLLAYVGNSVAGTVALRAFGNDICEMKRMFVYPRFHGQGVGRALATTLVSEARKAGYSRMRLETGHAQVAALGLYRSLGFREIPAYHQASDEQRANMTFMELRL